MPPGCEIQRVLPRTGRGPRKALVWGWPTPIALTARTELSPRATRAGVWAGRPRGSPAADAGGQPGEGQPRVAHEDKPLQGGERGATAGIYPVAGDERLSS